MAGGSTKNLSTQQKIWVYTGCFLRALAPLALYAFLPALFLAIGYVFGHSDMTMEEFFAYGANFYSSLGIFVSLFIFHRRSKKRGSTLTEDATLYFREMKPAKAIGFFIFGFASATAVSALITLLPEFILTKSYHSSITRMYLGRDFLLTLVTIMFTAPVTEEIIFRGYMLNTLLERLPENIAITVSSVIFALLHGSFIWMLYAFLLGQILAKTSMKEDNIAYGVLLHIGFNSTSIVNLLITESKSLNGIVFGSKALIALYGVLGLLASVVLAGLYTGRIERRKR